MKIFLISILLLGSFLVYAEDGHGLWLRQSDAKPVTVLCKKSSPTLDIAKKELLNGWLGAPNALVSLSIGGDKSVKGDGFRIFPNEIRANTDLGILYGVYELLRMQKIGQRIVEKVCNPSFSIRILNHWDNMDGSIERGYAGESIFWRKGDNALVTTADDIRLWQEYARANASVGINATVLNNVNASHLMLKPETLKRVRDIADVLRLYGIKTYLSVKFSSPSMIGGLKSSDPMDPEVTKWWNAKVREIYAMIPDFGGFLIKANSEGQPGPQDYGRTHVDGANMLADALKPFGGLVMWRAFVYESTGHDRAKQAYNEFMPFDGKFRDNVIVQVKNGPIDFQPREPFSPLFGALKKTSVMAELQITQEYLGHSVHLAYLAPMWEEFLKSETFQYGVGSTVARCTDGSCSPQKYTAIAGVANIGLDTNWCGHHFAQSNWYAFGRLAWDNSLSSSQIADEWIKLTFGPASSDFVTKAGVSETEWDLHFLQPVKHMMLQSREAVVDYMMPLGLHHIFSADHHYGPGPWWAPKGTRKDWTPPYYHQAGKDGIGFNRTASGSNAVIQYQQPLQNLLANPTSCPDVYLLWFHHLPWNFTLKNGRELWDELCYRYDGGVQQVKSFQQIWDGAVYYVDTQRFTEVQNKLREQVRNAHVWKDACLLYFQQFSNRPIPNDIERPVHALDDLIKADMERFKK
jgi:alpha-glucuronidase